MSEFKTEDGWFYAADSRVRDDDGNAVGSLNVVGRFEDFEKLDVPASKVARRKITKVVPALKVRIIANALGHISNDATTQEMRFTAQEGGDFEFATGIRAEAEAKIRRFPEAWAAYQKTRTAPIVPGEAELMEEMGLTMPKPKEKKPRAKRTEANVIQLKAEVA